MPGAQDGGIVAPYSEKVNNCPKVTQLVNDMSVIWYLVYIIPVLLSPIVLPCPKFLWWSKYRTMIPFCKKAKRKHASWEPRASLPRWPLVFMIYDEQLLRITQQNNGQGSESQEALFSPRQDCWGKNISFLHQLFLFWKQHFGQDRIPWLKVTIT